jgi:hypothetical protein
MRPPNPLHANPTMGWILLGVLVALWCLGVGSVSGLGVGTAIAACFYPSRPGDERVY